MIKAFDIKIELAGKAVKFSVNILDNGLYQLHVKSKDESLTIDMSQGQLDSLGASLNDADYMGAGFVGQEFGDA